MFKSPLFLWLMVFIFPLSSYSDPADTNFAFISDSAIQYFFWQQSNPLKDPDIRLSNEGALRGAQGMVFLRKENFAQNLVSARAPIAVKNDLWTRFYLRLDSCWNKTANEAGRFHFLALSFSDLPKIPRPILFSLLSPEKDSSLFLICRVRPFMHSPDTHEIINKINKGETYCVETHCDFSTADSLFITFYLNGDSAGSIRCKYIYPKNFIEFNGYSDFNSYMEWRLSVDECAASWERLLPKPPNPVGVSHTVIGGVTVLSAPLMKSDYRNELPKAVQWRVFDSAAPAFPVFDCLEIDPGMFLSRRVPFPLPQGRYGYQMRYQNNFNQFSYWSKLYPITIETSAKPNGKLENLYISKTGSDREIEGLVPGTWYDLHLILKPGGLWDSLGYLLIYMHDSSYTFGSAENKGGRFFSHSSYVLNLSLWKKRFLLFEKNLENSFLSERLNPDSSGLYTGSFSRHVSIDTLSGKIRLRFRLLPDANKGQWEIVAFFRDSHESLSNIYRHPINVGAASAKTNSRTIVVLCVTITLSLIVFLIRKYRRTTEAPITKEEISPEFNRISEFIRSNSHEKISVNQLLEKLRISKGRYQQVMRAGNEDFQSLLNKFRIEKAKILLTTTEKSISEICYEVGFASPTTFFRVFREIEGVPPGQYKRVQ